MNEREECGHCGRTESEGHAFTCPDYKGRPMSAAGEPRTEEGRETLADPYFAPPQTPFYDALKARIIAIEAEAARQTEPRLDEGLRLRRGWPTPNHMRQAADALDLLTPAKYGDILRWCADSCDGIYEAAASEEGGS